MTEIPGASIPCGRKTGTVTAGERRVRYSRPFHPQFHGIAREKRRRYSSPENRSQADCRVIRRAVPMRAQVTLRSRKMVTSRWRLASV